jgi:uncharacterized protein (DUF3820 family)
MSFNIDEYVDVAERIHSFYERFPDGRLVTADWENLTVGDRQFIVCHAKAFRNPDDPLPGDGLAWEPVPGPTQFTKDSELMNAQTAAWGRAIVALGFDTKKIASKQEVQARHGNTQSVDRQAADVHGLQSSRADAVQPGQVIVPFGKHKGTQVKDVPRNYWDWWLAQDGKKDPVVLAAVELHLGLTAPELAADLDGLPF